MSIEENQMRHTHFALAGVAVLAFLKLAGPVSAATLSVTPSTNTVSPGGNFTLNISVGGIVDLAGFQFDIGFSPSVLFAISITEGPFLPLAGTTIFFPGSINNAAGSITSIADSLVGVTGESGSGTVAAILFLAGAGGTSPITISNALLLNSTLTPIAVTVTGGNVTVGAVPEPATLGLVVAGALIGGWLARCTRRKQRVLGFYGCTQMTTLSEDSLPASAIAIFEWISPSSEHDGTVPAGNGTTKFT